ncbi:hypothetical protein [Streptomyces sp. H27-D2]|uniref:hypothetical protein n=1 Tax=Streptomyces sp. H27-D2 TaxID=3046304 RepID=UPI002DBAC5C1|nr:hypothetical protein [Streptomyces sp. H27-D2]MEC4019707.1 hypothetical protein [Streptomyces sp. H27-D2]
MTEAAAAALLWSRVARVWHLAAMAAVCGAASAFSNPAGGVLVEIVPAEIRHKTNALLKIGQNTVKAREAAASVGAVGGSRGSVSGFCVRILG